MNGSQRKAHQATELNDDQFYSGVVVVPFDDPSDQIRTCHENYGRQGRDFIQNEQRKMCPRNISCDVVPQNRIQQRCSKYYGKPPGGDGLPQTIIGNVGIAMFRVHVIIF